MKSTPPSGSLREWVLILYLDRMEEIEHARFRALAQILLTVGAENQEAGIEAFEDYMNRAFPNLKSSKKKKQEQMVEVLKHWVAQGPLSVLPLEAPKRARSKMVSRITGVETGPIARATAQVGGLRSK